MSAMPPDQRSVTAQRTLAGYVATLFAFVVLDAIWLVLFAIEMFRQTVAPILRDQPNAAAAIAFYSIYSAGLYALAVRPATTARSYRTAVANGAMVGLTAYATFDLTNLAIIKGWTPALAALDMAWGTAASVVAASAGYVVATRSVPGWHDDGGPGRT